MNLHTDQFAILQDTDTKSYMLYHKGTYLWRYSISDLIFNTSTDKYPTTYSLVELANANPDYEVLYSYPSRDAFIEAHPELLI